MVDKKLNLFILAELLSWETVRIVKNNRLKLSIDYAPSSLEFGQVWLFD